MFKRILLATAMLAAAVSAHADVDIVATTSTMGMLARTVGGEHATVTVLAPPDRDAHNLLARPSMMIALRRADLLLAVGADLEVAWLPAALRGAGNPRILPGQNGYFDGAAQIELLETDAAADRSRGDVHPSGNPHYYMDPERLSRVGQALALRLAQIDPSNRDRFRDNADRFARQAAERLPRWRQLAEDAPGVVFYHKDGNYLAALVGVPVLGFIEPLPGIPPSASHLRDLVQRFQGQAGVILYNSFHSGSGPAFLARHLGWPARQLQHEVPLDADATAYLDHIERWVVALTTRPAAPLR
jgi:zinc/manganese transport system substrate-binding protein